MARKREREGDVLGSNSTAAGEHIESDTFAEEEMPCFTPDGRNMLNGLKRLALAHVPFDSSSVHMPSRVPNCIYSTDARSTHPKISKSISPDTTQCEAHSLAPQRPEHFLKKWHSCKHGRLLSLAEQKGLTVCLAHNEPSVVERGCILREPSLNLGLPARREQIGVRFYGGLRGSHLDEGLMCESGRRD